MTLAELRAALATKVAAIDGLKEKAFATEASAEDIEAFDKAIAEAETIEKQVALAERAEAVAAKSTATVPHIPAPGNAAPVPAAAVIELKAEEKLGLLAAAQVKSFFNKEPIVKVLDDNGYGVFAKSITTASDSAGVLVPQPLQREIIELLRPQTTFLQGNPRRVPLTHGKFKQPRGASGAQAGYVGEGALKPITGVTFDSVDLSAKKLTAIVPLTDEAKAWSLPDLEGYVRTDLQRSMSQAIDTAAYWGPGTNSAPRGILTIAGIGTRDTVATDAKWPTIQEIDREASWAVLSLTTANIAASESWAWLMSYRTLEFLKNIRVGDTTGVYAYPELRGTSPTWNGFRVLVSNQVPDNGGGTTDESSISLIDFAHVLFGEDGTGTRVKVSDQATLQVGTETVTVPGVGEAPDVVTEVPVLLHLFQQNQFAILIENQHDFGLRHLKAVAVLKKVRWGAP
ncbi:phage major capsid protein [Pseudochelatococcus sp. B33]